MTFSSVGRFAVRSDAVVARTKTAASPRHPVVHRFDQKERRCALPSRIRAHVLTCASTASNLRNRSTRTVPDELEGGSTGATNQRTGCSAKGLDREGTPRGGDGVLGDACHVQGHVVQRGNGWIHPSTSTLLPGNGCGGLSRLHKRTRKDGWHARMPYCQRSR